ncbi:MAG: GAF domain-containing protein [Elusimicrobia bacterium]|nr:GAF domain-containing protein [Elusimicrobiota bacterium]
MAESSQESLELLLDVCRLLSSKLELSGLLTTIMQLSSRVVNAETASLLLLDPATNELYFDVALGLDEEVSKIRLKMGQGIAGSVAKEGKPLVINDVKADPRWSSMVDKQSGFQTRSIMAAPMEIKGKLLGVVEAINHIDGPFSYADLHMFEAFASQAAIAIDNARLFASLREEKTKLETVFARMHEAAVLIDHDGKVLLVNESARKSFTVGGKPPATLSEALADVVITPPLPQIMASDRPMTEFELVREQPKKLILAGSASALDFKGSDTIPGWNGKLLVFRDVTEERREELLKRSFLSLISHKLKTPLASITGYSQILLDDPAITSSEMASKGLDSIFTQGRKLTELVEKLLRFTTLEDIDGSAFRLTPFKVDDLIAETVAGMKPWLDEQKGTVVAGAPSGAVALGDTGLIKDVVKNLIENGVKFNVKPEKSVSIWSDAKDGQVCVHVKDQGPGIPPEDQDKIFRKFYQVESSFTGQVEGWGLGLPFVKKVIQHHGGQVRIDSRLNEGTEVAFTLPKPRQ